MLNGVEHGEEKQSSEHALHHSSDADTDRTEKHLSRPCTGTPAFVDAYSEHQQELEKIQLSITYLTELLLPLYYLCLKDSLKKL